mmetsp:Transcript_81019/g.203975  ORF Transcript_81019/g.203975 Transcript_81019/m.203975 type:complete len:213 (-) Transcript_81019:166-804(-)
MEVCNREARITSSIMRGSQTVVRFHVRESFIQTEKWPEGPGGGRFEGTAHGARRLRRFEAVKVAPPTVLMPAKHAGVDERHIDSNRAFIHAVARPDRGRCGGHQSDLATTGLAFATVASASLESTGVGTGLGIAIPELRGGAASSEVPDVPEVPATRQHSRGIYRPRQDTCRVDGALAGCKHYRARFARCRHRSEQWLKPFGPPPSVFALQR